MSGLQDALSGQGRLFLLAGEPGIGKTRLAEELTIVAREHGARALWGWCWEAGGAPAYWPWVQSIRAYIRSQEPAAVRAQIGRGAQDIAQMLPEIREIVPDLPPPPVLDPEGARFHLFDATTTFLRNAAAAQPLVIILDDLHAADVPSLLLLQFAAAELATAPVMMVAAYRDIEPGQDSPLRSILIELARQPATRHITLAGLTPTEVGRFIEQTAGVTPPPALVTVIHHQTEGNPLFVSEIVRLLVAEGRLKEARDPGSLTFTIPQGVRAVIEQRLRRLSEECRRLLSLVSVLGREFSLEAVSRASGLPSAGVLAVLDEAVKARVVTEVPGVPGRLRFAHALIRDTLYEDVSAVTRMQLHRQIGEVLEQFYGHDLAPHLAELAHHFFHAAPAGDIDKAVTYARQAGERAATLLAYEEAVRLYRTALQALDLKQTADQQTRCNLLLALGDAQVRAGEGPAARETFWQAAEIARGLGLREHLAQAALGYGGRFVWARARGDTRLIALLRDALDALGPGDSTLRAMVLARLAGALRDAPNPEERERYSRQAIEIARRLGDPATLAYALSGRSAAVWVPGSIQERLALADELLRVAEKVGDKEREFEGHTYRFLPLLELGDIPAATAEFEARARLAEELRQPAHRWNVTVARANLALMQGRFTEAEERITEALRLGSQAQSADASLFFKVEVFILRKLQGRLAELQDMIARTETESAGNPVLQCVLANFDTEMDHAADARRRLDLLARDGFAALPTDYEGLFGMSLLAEVVRYLAHTSAAGILYQRMLPFAHLNVVPGEVSTGAVARYLGILATVESRWDDAARHFDAALKMNGHTGARPWSALSAYDYALMLLSQDSPADRDRAMGLLAEALQTAHDLGMDALASRIRSLETPAAQPAVLPGRTLPRHSAERPRRLAARQNVFRREGEYWVIAYEGHTCRLKDSKGLRYLARLLRQPGREVFAPDLVVSEADGGPDSAAAPLLSTDREGLSVSSYLGDAGEVLDPEAKAAYRRRLDELDEELEEARAWRDVERAARAGEEREFLIQELARALGIGGRDRKAASATERARVNATRAIKSALLRIREHNPLLSRHLSVTIRTGTYCSYTPDPRLPVSWQS